ncbi:unnamed protein product [Cuscuta campestris]|uniref:Reverse transcriptase Ty1/copia-type domain-containing protein n=1 Tax=Cuscuta campestris TaxID=132261 RepID=A0A484LIK1_9ASTE|nr:unnamed protein product [Cuscuta campestris]
MTLTPRSLNLNLCSKCFAGYPKISRLIHRSYNSNNRCPRFFRHDLPFCSKIGNGKPSRTTPGRPSWLAEPAAHLTAPEAAALGVAVARLAAGTAAAVAAAGSRGATTTVVEADVDVDEEETLACNDTRMTATYLGTHRIPTRARTQFTHDILERADMITCRPISTPVDTKAKLSGTSGSLVADPALYRSIVGALQYLTFTGPDISYSVQQLCLHLHGPPRCPRRSYEAGPTLSPWHLHLRYDLPPSTDSL